MAVAFYNEVDPFAAQWLRNLISEGLIAPGEVDERDVRDIAPNELTGFTQCHFFAGIGVWSYALRLAGWPDDRPVWTGSCPCQPFSSAGQRKGFADERHLWPDWFWLVRQCAPQHVFGEQVAGKDGRTWLDLVAADLEAAGFTFGAVDLPACGVGAPHIRSRLFWVAYSGCVRRKRVCQKGLDGQNEQERQVWRESQPARICDFGDSWADAFWLDCIDGKRRPTQPGVFPMGNGSPSGLEQIRAYGNAIVAPVAAEFIKAAAAEVSSWL